MPLTIDYDILWPNMRCSEPGNRALVAIHASRGPGR